MLKLEAQNEKNDQAYSFRQGGGEAQAAVRAAAATWGWPQAIGEVGERK